MTKQRLKRCFMISSMELYLGKHIWEQGLRRFSLSSYKNVQVFYEFEYFKKETHIDDVQQACSSSSNSGGGKAKGPKQLQKLGNLDTSEFYGQQYIQV